MAHLQKTTALRNGYLRVEFTDGHPEIEHAILSKFMMSVFFEALLYGVRRIMIVVSTPRHDEYSISELERHALLADTIFGAMKLAYINVNASHERERFVKAYAMHLNDTEFGLFADEKVAEDWLMVE